MSAPQGFKDEGNGIYQASLKLNTKSNTNELYKFKVNNTTGIIDLYYPTSTGDKIFYRFDPTAGKWEIPKDSSDATDSYLNVIRSIGEPGSKEFEKLLSTSKSGADKIITSTSSEEDKNKILEKQGYKGLANTANGNEGEVRNAPPEPSISEANIDLINRGIQTKTIVPNHGDYRYPSEMRSDMDTVKFTMYDYGVRKLQENFLGIDSSAERRGARKGSATFGIQPRISDSSSVNWNDLEMDAPSLAAAGASAELITNGFGAFENIINKIGNTLGAEKSNVTEYGKLWFAQEAASIKGLTSRIGGIVLNPNLELLFQGPQLRPFSFNFQLSPRDNDEAKSVKQIIRFFKQGMAVQRSVTELFLKAPHIFSIEYMFKGNSDHPGLNKIKDCALIGFDVDYTPSGSYMTYGDGTMVSYNISLTFRELTPIYADEYQNPSNNENVNSIRIGY
jgi:hypothetical protein